MQAAQSQTISATQAAEAARNARDIGGPIIAAIVAIFAAGMLWAEVQQRPTLGEVQQVVDRSARQIERLIKVECK